VGESDDGTSKRLLGTLLTWMSERSNAVFMVATANDVSRLPPELIRKGRFDELFFVDLPTPEVRAVIFGIHLKKYGIDAALSEPGLVEPDGFKPGGFDLDALAQASEGYSGAEIEQAIVAAQYAALAEATPLAARHVLHELAQTRPLSVIRAEDFARLRAWADARCVRVD
jgi:SpoVK/Ycf46/Vps4 family AAA+-type ATPase